MIDHTRTQTVATRELTPQLAEDVITHFCNAYQARKDYVKTDCRWKCVLDARVGAIWVLHELTKDQKALRKHFNKTRTTVTNSLQKAEDWRRTDRVFRGNTDTILLKVKENL